LDVEEWIPDYPDDYEETQNYWIGSD